MKKILSIFTALCLVAPIACAAKPFLDHTSVDLGALLPPPPADSSPEAKRDLEEVLAVQKLRTKAEVEAAQADSEEEIWRFADAVENPKFSKSNLPKFTAFFERVIETEGAVVDPAKKIWNRKRPFMDHPAVKPVAKLSQSGSWPSGHATVGTMMAIILAQMLPERRAAIMARGERFALNRLVAGVHYKSDILMGQRSGTAIVAVLMTQKEFLSEFAEAKQELRRVLGI